MLERAGLSLADFAPIQHAVQRDGIGAASALVTPAMLHLGIVGDPEQVTARCAALMRSGMRHLSFGPPLGPDLLAAVDLLGTAVLPALR